MIVENYKNTLVMKQNLFFRKTLILKRRNNTFAMVLKGVEKLQCPSYCMTNPLGII